MAGLTRSLHTHTWRCKHALGDPIDYARVAAAQGAEVLGFADHVPLPDGRWSEVRMHLRQLPDYVQAVQQAREAFPELTILLGMECEYLPEFDAFYQELRDEWGCEYLIAAAHFVPLSHGAWASAFGSLHLPSHLRAYVWQCQRSLESGHFQFLAHPDLMGCSPVAWSPAFGAAARDICQCARDLGLPLELNTYGPRKAPIQTPAGERAMYPWRPFWEIAAEVGVGVVVNADAHQPKDAVADHPQVQALIRDLDLHLVDPLAASPATRRA